MKNEWGHVIVEGLIKTFQTGSSQVEVIKGIDLTIKRRQSLAVIGASGVGKSTLLHILGTLEEPTSGRVFLDGLDLYQQSPKALARIRNRKIGFVFQFHHLLSEFNALENTAMPALIQGLSRKDAYGEAEEMLVRVGLRERLRHRVGELSGGEQQRVAVARALVVEPELLLADEPTGNLDSQTGRRINELLIQLNEEKGLTTIVATHNLELASMMSSQIRLIDGRVQEER
ncbi:MAG: ABC transporter ATP-binding protein [Deltaproteobacteria bacterium]|nr:ABC transporter ATP-binding protein [Deltaproteobacteria bacterium]MBW2052756.1 ABC transporter ATP-binding protein [Deltaproteobacteria bacterium]MBW2139811.1 ABC transporter ATP-binding protein [Deltaproteobacteria bacterium]MBW2322715.1 ABC transporter ATP-binding protein [Deltaproteobacteria bacterium]